MSKLKDKLSANMRAVKANQHSPSTKATHAPAKPQPKAAEKPAAPAPRRAPASSDSLRDEVPNSANVLFPTRVWPD